MKRFEFTLNRILDYRQSLLEKEKNALFGIFTERNITGALIDDLKRQYSAVSGELLTITQVGTTIAEIQRLDMQLQACSRKLKERQQELARIEQRIEIQREVVKEVSQQVTGMEKLRDKQRDDYDYESRKEEEERIAELISTKVARQRA